MTTALRAHFLGATLGVREDALRRDRGISVERWLAAPEEAVNRDACMELPRPCPCLRCEHHIGERGDGSFSCILDFRDEVPELERTHERIGAVLGMPRRTVAKIEEVARDKVEREFRKLPPEVQRLLRLPRR